MMETANDSFQIVGQRPAPGTNCPASKEMVPGKALDLNYDFSSYYFGLSVRRADHDKGPHLYGSAKLQSGTEQRVFIWNGYHGKGYFFHALYGGGFP